MLEKKGEGGKSVLLERERPITVLTVVIFFKI